MRKLFKLRTLLIVVPVAGLLLALGSWLWWRWRVDAALEAVLVNGPDIRWEFDPYASPSKDDFAYLLSDQERVVRRLVAVVKSNDAFQRKVNALKAVRTLSARTGSFEMRKELLPGMISLACDPAADSSIIVKLAETIADWIPTTGATPEERAAICRKAEASKGEERIAWIKVLDSIRGRREVELMLRFGDTRDEDQFYAVYNSQFRGITWAGMLPHVKRWIRNPMNSERALEFSILSHTPEGRDVLLEFLSDKSQPASARTKAIERLTATVAGIKVLMAACADGLLAKELSDLLTKDCRQYLAAELKKVRDRNGAQLWNELIEGLDPSYWLPSSGTTLSAEVEAEYATARKQYAKKSLDSLRVLSGNSKLTTQEEWKSWLQDNPPRVIEQRDILQLILDHPEMMESSCNPPQGLSIPSW